MVSQRSARSAASTRRWSNANWRVWLSRLRVRGERRDGKRLEMKPMRWLLLFAGAIVVAGCSFLAVQTAPQKTASRDRTEAARKADELFWATLHGGHYDEIRGSQDIERAPYVVVVCTG